MLASDAKWGDEGADQSPARLGDLLDASNGFHEDLVRNASLGDPYCTQKVDPVTGDSLLERTAFVWAEYALLYERE